ncbi:MAG: hypothetical protein U0935_14880 [Pirellulales bacterium]
MKKFLAALTLVTLFATAAETHAQVTSLRNRPATPRPVAPEGSSRLLDEGKRIVDGYRILYKKMLSWRIEEDAIAAEQRRISRAESGGFASQTSVPLQQKLRLSARRTENNQLKEGLNRDLDLLKQRYDRWLRDTAAQKRRK